MNINGTFGRVDWPQLAAVPVNYVFLLPYAHLMLMVCEIDCSFQSTKASKLKNTFYKNHLKLLLLWAYVGHRNFFQQNCNFNRTNNNP